MTWDSFLRGEFNRRERESIFLHLPIRFRFTKFLLLRRVIKPTSNASISRVSLLSVSVVLIVYECVSYECMQKK